MKSIIYELPIYEIIRPRNQTSEKKKLIAFIKKQKDKKLELNGYKKKKKLVGYSNGEWTLREVKMYHRYLSSHRNEFTDPHLRKRNKVFIKLAGFIGSRTPDQCRSHHQKATFKFPDFEELLNNYETKIFHLSKLYEDVKQSSIRERQRSEAKRMIEEQHLIRMKGGSVEVEQVKGGQQKQGKLEENEQEMIQQKRIESSKVDKTTCAVIVNDYYSQWISGEGKVMQIQIDEKAMQQFK